MISHADAVTLTEANVGFARRCAASFSRHWPSEAPEFESAAMLALWQAASHFDPARGPFDAQLRVSVHNRCCDAWRASKHFHRAALSLSLSESPAPVEPPDGDDIDAFEALIAAAPARHREAFRMLFLGHLRQREAAPKLGLTRDGFCSLYHAALDEMRGRMQAQGARRPRR